MKLDDAGVRPRFRFALCRHFGRAVDGIALEEGMRELVAWLQEQEKPEDGVGRHAAELAARGLTL